jgi:hypothetical protein
MMSGWDLVLAGRYEEALDQLRNEYARDKKAPTLNNMGIVYLCVGDPANAKTAFDAVIERNPERGGCFDLAGVARWLLGDHRGAVEVWLASVDHHYQDASGGVDIALLLYFASVRDPGVYSHDQARKLLIRRVKSGWAKNWPGPLGRFVLREIDYKMVLDLATFPQPQVMERQLAQVEFYRGVVSLERRDASGFRYGMERCISAHNTILLPERYLARYELDAAVKAN